jgi:hypothetical protein
MNVDVRQVVERMILRTLHVFAYRNHELKTRAQVLHWTEGDSPGLYHKVHTLDLFENGN